MQWEITPRNTYQIGWGGGTLELNLQPMNAAVVNGLRVGYATARAEGVLGNSLADLLGVVGVQLPECPPVPVICWDNREHQYWDGNEGSYEPRNVLANAPEVGEGADGSCWASYYYISQLVKTTMHWRFHPQQPRWDTTITVENLRPETVEDYLQFFACYHRMAPNMFWPAAEHLQFCDSQGFVATATAREEALLRRSPFTTHLARYSGETPTAYHRYYRPLLLSAPQPWYAGGRHIVMVEPQTCAAVVTWGSQARDYIIRPPHHHLPAGGKFTTRVRHLIASVEEAADLLPLWREFEEYLAEA